MLSILYVPSARYDVEIDSAAFCPVPPIHRTATLGCPSTVRAKVHQAFQLQD